MTTDDLVPRILAAIEATEQDARQATRKDLAWAIDKQPFRWGVEEDTEVLAGGKPIVSCNYEYGGYTTAAHIVRHDPASVLRRCAADRRRLERHYVIPDTWGNPTCGYDRDGDDETDWPCPDVLDVADSYGMEPLNPEPGSRMAEDLAEGLAQVEAGEVVPAEVVVADLAARLAASASVHREEDWFIAQATSVDVASQGRTEAEARANLREAVELYLTTKGGE